MRYAFVLFVLFLSSSVSAQTVEATLDPASLGIGAIEMPQAVDTDGNEATQEWLIRSVATRDYRVIAAGADGRLCMGDWFSANRPPQWFVSATVQKVGHVHKLVTHDIFSGVVTVIGLTTPQCDD